MQRTGVWLLWLLLFSAFVYGSSQDGGEGASLGPLTGYEENDQEEEARKVVATHTPSQVSRHERK